jgi:hypothetical protein
MTTWVDVSGLGGYYESSPIPFSLDGDGAISKVTWTETGTENTSLKIYTSVSYDGGYDWTDWKQCTQGGTIPDVLPSSPLKNAALKFRAFLKTKNINDKPILASITFEFEPVIVFDNKGDTFCQPEIWITKKGAGDFSLVNISNNNEEFKFTGLNNNETVYVNNEREYIETDLAATYRYLNFNDNYLNLPVGENVFRVNGSARIQFRYQFKLI